MMSGHDVNPIFCNKKKKIRLDVQNTCYPPPATSDNISFLPHPHPTPFKVDVICVLPLLQKATNRETEKINEVVRNPFLTYELIPFPLIRSNRRYR